MFDEMNSPSDDFEPAGPTDDSELIQGHALRVSLGFQTGEAFRAAIRAGRIPIALIKLPGRRGWFARARDIAEWKASVARKFDQATPPIP